MKRRTLNLDSEIRGKPAFLWPTGIEVGIIDDVIIDPTLGVLAMVVHGASYGTWAFPYAAVRILAEGITIPESGGESPRKFERLGKSYQDLLGGTVADSNGSVVGRIQSVDLVDLPTGEIAYRVSPPGIRSLWGARIVVHAPTEVMGRHGNGIVLKNSEGVDVGADGGGPPRDVEPSGRGDARNDRSAA